jgi:hypothetical protein
MPAGRKVGTVKFAPPFKVRFEFGFMEEVEALLARARAERLKYNFLRSRQRLLREALRRGMDSILSEIEEAEGPQQLAFLLDESEG